MSRHPFYNHYPVDGWDTQFWVALEQTPLRGVHFHGKGDMFVCHMDDPKSRELRGVMAYLDGYIDKENLPLKHGVMAHPDHADAQARDYFVYKLDADAGNGGPATIKGMEAQFVRAIHALSKFMQAKGTQILTKPSECRELGRYLLPDITAVYLEQDGVKALMDKLDEIIGIAKGDSPTMLDALKKLRKAVETHMTTPLTGGMSGRRFLALAKRAMDEAHLAPDANLHEASWFEHAEAKLGETGMVTYSFNNLAIALFERARKDTAHAGPAM